MSLGIFFEARFEDDFYWISDPPEPQKPYENLMFFKDFTFSARSLWTSILGRFLIHFRAPDPKKIGPQRCSNATRKKIQKKIAFGRLQGRFCMDFGTQLGSEGGGPRTQFWAFFGALGLSWGEDGPRMRQERFQDRFWTDFGRFLVDVWSIFCCSLPPFL